MRSLNEIVAIALCGLVIAANAVYADNLDAAKLHDLDNSLRHHSSNIATIRQELIARDPKNEQSIKDGEYSNAVVSVLSDISIEVESLIENRFRSGRSESELEMPGLTPRKDDGSRVLREKCGSNLDKVNLNLNKIIDGEIHFEVKYARDDVVKVCDIIHRWE